MLFLLFMERGKYMPGWHAFVISDAEHFITVFRKAESVSSF